MDELRNDFLAGAALPADEDRCVSRCDLSGQLDGLPERGRNADEGQVVGMRVLPHHLHPEVGGFATLEDGVRRPADQNLQVRGGERLGEIIPGAHPQCFNARGNARIARHHDDEAIAVGFQRGVEDFQPGDQRHEEVDQNEVELTPADQVEGFLAASRQSHAIALTTEDRGAALPERALVINNEDPD